ncbi:protein Aster-B-like isoform X1 [Harmonia axyridis]|uniref:protein Aster-B-like isoform X1 n=1 Tax=Harmonia axyridis TaxID=115357 RepID=UPI001E27795D|nr:protein Aster-B-like isoform X1 [Harmonia axyridis]
MSSCGGGDIAIIPPKLSLTPKGTPTCSPQLPPKLEVSLEQQSSDNRELNSGLPEDPVNDGLDGKSPNTDINHQEVVVKNDVNQIVSTKEKKKKKSSWFNTFYPTYKSRSEDFKRIFKDVPDDERLVVDYSCAVQKEILVHGRLYVTQNYLCFYANIFGWETNIVLRWKDVTAITKEKTALVIPNAVLISTKTEKFFFTSFVARDKVYLMLFRVWQNALMDRQMSNQEMWQWVHQSYGAELGLTSDDEDYIAPGTEEIKTTKASSESLLEENKISSATKEKMVDEGNNGNSHNNSTNSKKSSEAHDSIDDDSDFSDLDIPAQCDIQDISCTCSHEGRQLLNEILPINVDQLFTLLFTSSKFYLDFHAFRKTTDLVQTPWTPEPKDNTKIRKVNQTVNLTQALGPKTSQVTEIQIMLPCSKPGLLYSINSESISGGVPYGDSFVIEVHYCLKKVSDKQSSLTVNAQVKFKKSVWGLVKGMIEKNCWSGLEDYFVQLLKALKTEAEEMVPDIKRKVKKKRKLHSTPRATTPVGLSEASIHSSTTSTSLVTLEKPTIFIFVLIILLFVLNVFLLMKLWTLEEEKPPSYLFNIHSMKKPPTTNDEWLSLLKVQDNIHSKEIKRWQELLSEALDSLKKTNYILSTLQKATAGKPMENVENKEFSPTPEPIKNMEL